MNTPAHVVVNLLCIGRRDTASTLTPVVAGAILPDAPMFIFYFVEKIIHQKPEMMIWRQSYYQSDWQNFIDFFNSLPLMLIGLSIAAWISSKVGMLVFSSMILHVAGDLPLHHDDAHRHFFPFSNWRFISSFSYWDSHHYGNIVSSLEILAVIIGSTILFRMYRSHLGKIGIAIIGVLYFLHFLYALAVWQ